MASTLYFVAGEASGDEHGAALMRALGEAQPDLQFRGRGGPQMKAIAFEGFQDWIEAAGVVGLWEVVKQYGYFRAQFRDALKEIESARPDAVVLIDYPGFNLRLARALAKAIAHTENYLLHQPASVGVESRPHSRDGAHTRSHALHLSV